MYGFLGNSPRIFWDMLGLEFKWETREYAPFIQHYYHGEGSTFDLIAEGYLSRT